MVQEKQELQRNAPIRRSASCPVLVRLRLKEEIISRDITCTEMAELAQVSRSTITNMCNNPIQKQWDNQTIAAIAFALNLKNPGMLFEFISKESIDIPY